MRPARMVALDWMVAQAEKGERETGGANRSVLIDKVNRAAGVALGSPYCAAAVHYAFRQAGIADFGGPDAASVGWLSAWAKAKGWLTVRPHRGDAFCWMLDGDDWPDHAGMVRRVVSWGGVAFTCLTVEANTSSGNAGSQADGGGWYLRTRTFRRGRVMFVHDPRKARRDPYTAKPKRKPPKPKPSTHAWPARLPGWFWGWAKFRRHPSTPRPKDAPHRVPAWAWRRLAAMTPKKKGAAK